MSDGALSQDEIDALLQGNDDSDDSSMGGDFGFGGDDVVGALSKQETSAFLDLINDASANIGGALGAMVSKEISISNPRVEVIDSGSLQNQLDDEVVEVRMDFEAGVVGEHYYILDVDTSAIIGGLMMGQEGNELTEASLSAVSEAMNVISGNSSNTIGTKIQKDLKPAPPQTQKTTSAGLSLSPGVEYVKVLYDLSIEDYPSTNLVEIYGLNVVKDIVNEIMPASNQNIQQGSKSGMKQPNMMGQQGMGMQPNMMGQQGMGMQPNMMGQQGMGMQPNMMGQQGMGMMPNMMGQQGMEMMPNYQQVPIQGVQFQDLNRGGADSQGGNINLLMDVNMEMTVELGRTRKSIKEILGMGEGTVIELDKLAGEPVDVLVNGKLIARGEVVVIDENFGVRVTDIVNPADRIANIG